LTRLIIKLLHIQPDDIIDDPVFRKAFSQPSPDEIRREGPITQRYRGTYHPRKSSPRTPQKRKGE
jgi:hypothetical protein